MPLYPLGISRTQDVSRNVEAVRAGRAHVCWTRAGQLACAFVDAPHRTPLPLQHAAAIDAIHRHICVLPMRFGAAVRDKAEIHALLDARRDGLLDRLDQLDGACEMALRIAPQNPIATPTDQAPTNPSPLAYLERRRSYYQQADAAAELNCPMERQFLERLYGLFRDWRKLSPGPAHLTRLALLVDRNHVAALRLRAANSFRAGDSSRCQVLGPWPPYSFV